MDDYYDNNVNLCTAFYRIHYKQNYAAQAYFESIMSIKGCCSETGINKSDMKYDDISNTAPTWLKAYFARALKPHV